MELTRLGHACFRLRGRDIIIVADPFGGNDLGYPPVATAANIVTVSHDHPHHASLDGVTGAPRVLRGPGEYEIGGAMVWGIRTFRRGDGPQNPRAQNTSFRIQLEDVTICHLGDLGHPLTPEQLEGLKDSDVLLIPVGGHCTIGAAEAVEVVAQIEPKIVIPMHYATAETEGRIELDPVERFCREMGMEDMTPQTRLAVSAGSLPAEPTVVLLEPVRR